MMNSPFTIRTEFIAANITSGAKTPEPRSSVSI